MFTPIAGRAVVVTGGTKGIGKGIARVFAAAGANVVVIGRDPAAGEAAAAELGENVAFVQGDVAVGADCERAAAEAAERLGGVDVLCANAGIFPAARLEEMTEEDLDGVPRMTQKRRALLERALAIYQDLLASEDSPLVREKAVLARVN